MSRKRCRIKACVRQAKARGMCHLHYQRWRANPGRVRRPVTRRGDASSRFWSKVTEAPDGCWMWTGSLNRDGYGTFWVNRSRVVLAHGWAYTHMIGEVPDGLQLDHTCRVRACVNPFHLDPVTAAVNVQRALAAKKQAA